MGNVLTPLANSALIPLGLTAAVKVVIQAGKGTIRVGQDF